MRNKLLLGAAVAFSIASCSIPEASAQQVPCGKHQIIKEKLEKKFGETVIAMGLQSNGQLLEIYVSVKTSSWTILNVTPDGNACIVSAGKNWFNVIPPVGDLA